MRSDWRGCIKRPRSYKLPDVGCNCVVGVYGNVLKEETLRYRFGDA